MTEKELQDEENELNDMLIDDVILKCDNVNDKCKYLYDRLKCLEEDVSEKERTRLTKELVLGVVLSVALLIYKY